MHVGRHLAAVREFEPCWSSAIAAAGSSTAIANPAIKHEGVSCAWVYISSTVIHAVADGLDDPGRGARDFRIEKLAAQPFEAFKRAFLAGPTSREYSIGGEDRGETAGLARAVSPAARRRPDRNSSRCSGLRNCEPLGTTTGVIARSRSTISRASSIRADRIIVLEEGRVAAAGSHAELLSQGGLYARLAALQFDQSGVPISDGKFDQRTSCRAQQSRLIPHLHD
jgi:hypothetical protein